VPASAFGLVSVHSLKSAFTNSTAIGRSKKKKKTQFEKRTPSFPLPNHHYLHFEPNLRLGVPPQVHQRRQRKGEEGARRQGRQDGGHDENGRPAREATGAKAHAQVQEDEKLGELRKSLGGDLISLNVQTHVYRSWNYHILRW